MDISLVFLICASCFHVTSGYLSSSKPGCPRQSGPFGICVHECRSDHECSGNKICCANGCGYQCKEPCPLKKCKAIDCSKHGGFAYSKRGCRECHCVCPPEKSIVNCGTDPCQVTRCVNYPDATCKANFCGGCNAEFYWGGKKINCNK